MNLNEKKKVSLTKIFFFIKNTKNKLFADYMATEM